MNPELCHAAVNGDMGFLNSLQRGDSRLQIILESPSVGVETPLHIALRHGHVDFAMKILDLNSVFAGIPNEGGFYPLHLAAARGYVNVVNKLLDIDRSLSCLRDKAGGTALSVAVLNEKEYVLEALYPVYKEEVDLRKALVGKGVTALSSAPPCKIEQGLRQALAGDRDDGEELILHFCVVHNKLKSAMALVKLDEELLNKKDAEGNTALHYAAAKKNPESFKHLRDFVLQKSMPIRKDHSIRFECDACFLVHPLATYKCNPVQTPFCKYPSSRVKEELLHAKQVMDPELRNAATNGDVGFLSGLRKDDHRLLIFFDCTPVSAETPLHVALLHEHPEFATAILKLSPELARMPNERGSYPLHLASARGYVAVVKELLNIDPSLSCLRDKEGRTALASAALNEKVEVLNLLYPIYKRQVEYRKALGNEREELILHICVEHNLLEMAKVLVALDKKLLKMWDDNSNTALHLAAAKENTQDFLLEKMEREDHNDFTAFNIRFRFTDKTEDEEIQARWRTNPFLSNLWDIWRKKDEV